MFGRIIVPGLMIALLPTAAAQALVTFSLGDLTPAGPVVNDGNPIPVTLDVFVSTDGSDSIETPTITIATNETIGADFTLDGATNEFGFAFPSVGAVNANEFQVGFFNFGNPLPVSNTPQLFTTVSLTIDPAYIGTLTLTLTDAEEGATPVTVGGTTQQSITVVPEPASLALLGLGGLALVARRRRAA